MTVINTNISAIRAANASNSAAKSLGMAMERLSTGKRINSAKDDAAGMAIAGQDGIAADFLSACDHIALHPVPVPFEASLMAPDSAAILARGVALPLFAAGHHTGVVQIVVSWREVLNRVATMRLRRELGAALRFSAPNFAKTDPFLAKSIA